MIHRVNYFYKMAENPVVIEDDDEETESVVVVGEDAAPIIATIDLDDDEALALVRKNKRKAELKAEEAFVKSLRNNKRMDKLVKLSLSLSNTAGMPRVINRTLLPLYKDTSPRVKRSKALRKLLKKTHKLLIEDPDHKFLHIKTLCDELKSGTIRKKVPFVTLASNLQNRIKITGLNNNDQNRLEVSDSDVETIDETEKDSEIQLLVPRKDQRTGKATKRKPVGLYNDEDTDVIDIADSDDESVSTQDERLLNNEEQDNNNKENNKRLETEIHMLENSINATLMNIKYGLESDIKNTKTYHELLTVQTTSQIDIPCAETAAPKVDINLKVRQLERDIAFCKVAIGRLEEAEVTEDTSLSPYVQCDIYKRKLVSAYRELAKLKGSNPDLVKRREIKLRIAEGYEARPAKILEDYLNDTIDRTGMVEFPDFQDVQDCVLKANSVYSLGWCKKKIYEQAVTLFQRCGNTLSKHRQKREYRDLLRLMKDESVPDDPAETDPALLAALEENKKIAIDKANEILERFVNIEKGLIPYTPMDVELEQDSSDSDSDHDNITGDNNIREYIRSNKDQNQNCITNSAVNNTVNPCNDSNKTLVVDRVCNLRNDGNYVAGPNIMVLVPQPSYYVTDKGIKEVGIDTDTTALNQGKDSSDATPDPTCKATQNNIRNFPPSVVTVLNNAGIDCSTAIVAGPYNLYDQTTTDFGFHERLQNHNFKTNAGTSSRTVLQNKNSIANPCTSFMTVQNHDRIVNSRPILLNGNFSMDSIASGNIETIRQNPRMVQLESMAPQNHGTVLSSTLSNKTNFQADCRNSDTNIQKKNSDFDPCTSIMTVQNHDKILDSSLSNNTVLDLGISMTNLENHNIKTEACTFMTVYNHDKTDNASSNNIQEFRTDVSKTLTNSKSDVRGNDPCTWFMTVQNHDRIVDSKTPDKEEENNNSNKEATSDKCEEENEVKIKKEPLDIPCMLEKIGDSFVSTVFDIEDPFLVVEISSSDSSSDDNC